VGNSASGETMGLINSNMQQGPAPEEQMPAGQPPAGEMEDEGPEDTEGIDAAVNEARRVLYKDGGAENVAKAMKSARTPSEGAAMLAYDLTAAAMEKTGVDNEENLAAVAMAVLEEVADIAEAVGMPLKNSDLADAMKQMILRLVEETGADAAELRAAMDQVDPAQFDQMEEEPMQ
jgi:hypothetical protein